MLDGGLSPNAKDKINNKPIYVNGLVKTINCNIINVLGWW